MLTEAINLLFSNVFIQLLIFGAMFLSAFFLVLEIFPDESLLAIRRRLGVDEEAKRPATVPMLRIFRPLYSALLPWIAPRQLEGRRKYLARQLLTAHLQEEMTPDEFIGFQVILTLLIPLLVGYISGALDIPIPLPLWPAVFVGGYLSADLWLWEQIRARRKAILRALPYTLDLLTLSVEAGLDFIAAIQRLAQRTKSNALIAEFNQVLKEIRLATSRADALRNMSDRLKIEEISSFTTLLIQADQLGASIGGVLRAQADQLRTARFQAAEAAGAKASQLLLFPLVLCLLPATVIIALGPALISVLQKGLF